ncbi:hypothetical protein HELRODRAFT_77614 [Helobdella robusta]|uniref:Cilia- and flagella-associated protein 57 n=1 Tax=Helobdella robusta TaxID=6412 RepID=T1G307_HELRO|nr:hypothetical protein HELRODRAFT_77614 [Helobdella robusta]ESO05498.1 hypothetical protein HELRODRAFT_77614 [Helobdella robusta]
MTLTPQYAEVNFTRVTPLVHTDVITGLDVCVRKPYIATCSLDKSVKIWDYSTFVLKVSKTFSESLLSLSMHPRGHILLIGFSTCVKLLNIFTDDLQPFKVLPISPCTVCSFAHGGHMFAVAKMNIVEIYSSVNFQLVSLFKTHLDMVRSMCWTDNDARIVSAGRDGAIYEWEVLTAKRFSENVVKGCSYSSIVLDGKNIYAVGSDQAIKEINDSVITMDLACGMVPMTQITMTHSSRIMFLGLSDGRIRSMRFPLTDPPDWIELNGHCAAIRGLRVTCDDHYLISSSEDTSLIVWQILDRHLIGQTRVAKPYTAEVLVLPPDVEKKDNTIRGLELRAEELQSEIPYQVLQKDITYNEALHTKLIQFFAEVELLKEVNMLLTKEQKALEEAFMKSVGKLQKKYEDQSEIIETQNKQLLMAEFGKYQELKDKDTRMKKEYRRKLDELDRRIDITNHKLKMAYDLRNKKVCPFVYLCVGRLSTCLFIIVVSSSSIGRSVVYDFSREWEEMKRQIEEDNDTRIMDFLTVLFDLKQ